MWRTPGGSAKGRGLSGVETRGEARRVSETRLTSLVGGRGGARELEDGRESRFPCSHVNEEVVELLIRGVLETGGAGEAENARRGCQIEPSAPKTDKEDQTYP